MSDTQTPRKISAQDFRPVAAVVATGMVIAACILFLVRGYYYTADRDRFQRDATDFGAAFKSVMDRHVSSLEAIRAFVSASHAVSRWEFSNFAHQLLPQNAGFKAVLWLPNLESNKRATFEAEMARDGLFGLKLRKLTSDGTLVFAGEQATYIPVSFVEPFEASGDLIGVDLSNNPIYAPLFQAAKQSGKVAASAPREHALLDGVRGPVLLLAFPLIGTASSQPTDAPAHLKGFALGVLQLDWLVQTALGRHAPVQAAISYDVNGKSKVFQSSASNRTLPEWFAKSEFQQRIPFVVGGRKFILAIRPITNGEILTRFYVPAGAALLVLALTALLTQSMLTTILRKRVVERAVIERTAELRTINKALGLEIGQRKDAESALRVARDKAENANRAKSAFLSTMSHELRTPLNSVIGFSEMLMHRRDLPHEKIIDYSSEINGSGVRLLDLINDILEITQMDTDPDNSDLVYLPDVVSAVIDRLQSSADQKGVMLDSTVAPIAFAVKGNGKRLQKALYNLVSNSIKFTEQGGRARISTQKVADGLLLEVVDTGVGLEPGAEARIMELFAQADDGLARRHEGVGLGLTFVQRVATGHGAKLRITGKPGVGTRVSILFPPQILVEVREVA